MTPPHGGPLVVGASGFLGRHVLDALTPMGAQGTSRRGDDGLIPLDLSSISDEGLRQVLTSCEPRAVVNCAGRTTGTLEELEAANVTATGRLLTALDEVVPGARYVHLGSAAEYGPPARAHVPVSEEDEASPVADYGRTKLCATRAVLAYAYDHGVDAVVLRVFNPVGGGAPITTLPGRTARLIREAGPDGVISLGPLDALRDFVDARDVASAVRAVLEAETTVHTVYNVGSGRATSARELVEALTVAAAFVGELTEERPTELRSGGVSWQAADVRRLKEEFGWKPEYGLADSVRALWEGA